MPTLKRIVKDSTGQDLARCQACYDCEVDCPDTLDIPIGSLIQLVLYNDEEVLSSRTLWSDCVLSKARLACKRGIDIAAVMQSLRDEAMRRGVAIQ